MGRRGLEKGFLHYCLWMMRVDKAIAGSAKKTIPTVVGLYYLFYGNL